MGTTDSPGAAVPLREDQDPRAAGGWPREAGPFFRLGPGGGGGQEGAVGGCFRSPQQLRGPRGAELISQKLQRGRHAQALAAHSPPPRACDYLKPGV